MNTAVLAEWETVCELGELTPDIGACALIGDRQVAIFRLSNGEQLFAVDNYDPKSNAHVLSRGIVGDVKGKLVVASPLYKQHYSLLTGQCLEDDSVHVPTYKVRVTDGLIQVALPS